MGDRLLVLDDFLAARERIAGRVHRTPTLPSARTSSRVGVQVSFKAELFQKTGSFKIRGVLNKLSRMPAAELDAGLVSMSAGNHAAALAYGATVCGSRATIVMPSRAIPSKIEASQGYGGEIVLTDESLMEVVGRLQKERGLVLVHPFDDPAIMAGHGTIGLEILEEVPDVDTIVVPIGGGGLIGGISAAVKARRPEVRVIGVEPELASAMTQALQAGAPVQIGHPQTVADGLAAPFAGVHTLRHVQAHVDDVVCVDDESIVDALRWTMTRAKLAAEPSGAAPLAALFQGKIDLTGSRNVVCVVSGGNVDAATLRAIL